jgi:hypothetical protein
MQPVRVDNYCGLNCRADNSGAAIVRVPLSGFRRFLSPLAPMALLLTAADSLLERAHQPPLL